MIVINFDFNKMDISEAQQILESVRKQIPNEDVIGIPSFATISELSKEELIQIRNLLTEIIDSRV